MSYFYPESFIINVTGADATRYLGARLSNNVKALGPKQSCFAAALNHQGKPQGVFQVLKKQDDDYLLVADGPLSEEVLSALMQFKVADRVEAAIDTEHKVLHTTATPPENITALQRERTTKPGFDTIVQSQPDWISGEELSQEAQLYERILVGAPLFPQEIEPTKILTESGASHAVSFTKGCYLGQEVLEKIDSHGKAPSILVSMRIEGAAPLEKGTEIHNSTGKRVGSIVSTAANTQNAICFARLRALTEEVFADETKLTLISNRLSKGSQ